MSLPSGAQANFADALSFFVVYMCHHIKPTLVSSYLSGICSELEAFWPGMHKANQFFAGSTIVLKHHCGDLNPMISFSSYLRSCNHAFPHLPELWLHSSGEVPMCSWYINQLRAVLPSKDIAGHSLRSGGATALALTETPLQQIQSIGHWSSNAFRIYIRNNPILLQGSITGQSAFEGQCVNH